MTKIAFVSDVHVENHRRLGGATVGGINDRCQRILDVLALAAREAIKAECDGFIVAGDLFDSVRPTPQIITQVQQILEDLRVAACSPVILLGNHEQQSALAGDHSLGPLLLCADVVDKPRIIWRKGWEDLEVWCAPFQPGQGKDWLPDAMRSCAASPIASKDARRVLCVHLGMRDASTAPWLQHASDAIDVGLVRELCVKHGVKAVAAGNWHDRRSWDFDLGTDEEVRVLQVGALVPTGWDNPGEQGYGTLAIWDGDTWDVRELPGPRFVRMGVADMRKRAIGSTSNTNLFVQVDCGAEELRDVSAEVARAVEAKKIGPSEAVVDNAVVQAQARTAASAARSSKTLAEALEVYVRAMPLVDGVSREAVMARSRRYLGV